MNTIRTTQAKFIVQRAITKQAAAMYQDKKPLHVVTLCDSDTHHEEQLRKACPNAKISSLNLNPKLTKATKRLDNLHEVATGNIHDYPIESGRKLIWFDYCALVPCWDGFFESVAKVNSDSTFYVTFGSLIRAIRKSPWLKKNKIKIHGETKQERADNFARDIFALVCRRVRRMGWVPFYSVSYTVRAGRMVTVGFRRKNGNERGLYKLNEIANENANPRVARNKNANDFDLTYSKMVEAVKKLDGVDINQIKDYFGNSKKIAGLRRAATVRKKSEKVA